MGEPGDSTAALQAKAESAVKHLEKNPETNQHPGRQIEDPDKDKQKEEREYPRPGIKENISAHNPGDSTTGPDLGQIGVRTDSELKKYAAEARQQIEQKEFQRADFIFYIIAEDPQV